MALSSQLTTLHARVRPYVPGASLPAPLDAAGVRHLLRRTTWGATPSLVEEVTRDPQGWFDAQLAPESIDDATCEGYLTRFTKIHRTTAQVRAEDKVGVPDTVHELGMATFARYTWSRRQLFEVVCDFWSNHLNASNRGGVVWDNRQEYDRDVIRRHALGSFEEMLIASAKHPAMLRYLDNTSSTKKAPNENYAREVMELHTVGVDAGYGEAGVKAAARVFTGMTIDKNGAYTYDAGRHDISAATVMGWSTPAHAAAQGEAVAVDLLSYLAGHSATATTIARKLAIRFVSDSPPASLVADMAAAYSSGGTQVLPVLRVLFASDEFWASAGQKTRRPLEGYVAAVRAVGSTPGAEGYGGIDTLFRQSRDLGHEPLAWAPPNGYPDVAVAWRSAGGTVQRWNTTTGMVQGWSPKPLVRAAPEAWLPVPPLTNFGSLIDAVVLNFLGRWPTAIERAALLGFTEHAAGDALTPRDAWVSSRLPQLVATVLNSPGHMER